MQRIAVVLLDDFAVVIYIDMVAAGFEIGLAGQADKGIAAETLAADHRFEQIAERLVGQFEVEGQRGIQIGQQFLHQRNAVVTGIGLSLVFLFANHVSARLRVNEKESKYSG